MADFKNKETPLLEQTHEQRLAVYESLPQLGGDPKNTGSSVSLMVKRVSDFVKKEDYVSVINISAAR